MLCSSIFTIFHLHLGHFMNNFLVNIAEICEYTILYGACGAYGIDLFKEARGQKKTPNLKRFGCRPSPPGSEVGIQPGGEAAKDGNFFPPTRIDMEDPPCVDHVSRCFSKEVRREINSICVCQARFNNFVMITMSSYIYIYSTGHHHAYPTG